MKKIFSTFITICLIIAMIQAQETETEVDPNDKTQKTIVEVKEGENPDIYIDGKKYEPPSP